MKKILSIRAVTSAKSRFIISQSICRVASKSAILEYLKKSDELRAEPKWYNTLTSNCTTLIFDMVQAINPYQLPKDYRLIASGYLPNYLYDLKALNQNISLKQWYQIAHINPRTENFEQLSDQSSQHFSQIVRQGLPKAK